MENPPITFELRVHGRTAVKTVPRKMAEV